MRNFLLLAAAGALVPGAASAATIVNGSFEMGVIAPAGGFTTLGKGSTAITGWTVGGGGVDLVGTYWQASDGMQSVDLSGNKPGSLSQLLTGLTVGKEYTIKFDLAGNPDNASKVKVGVVSILGSVPDVYLFDATGKTRANMGWSHETFKFTADASSMNLVFATGNKSGAFGAVIDNVSFGGVPEPKSWALMIVGFGVVGGAMRRRNATRTTVRFA